MHSSLGFQPRAFPPAGTEGLEGPQCIQGCNPPPGKDACLEGRSNPSTIPILALLSKTFSLCFFPGQNLCDAGAGDSHGQGSAPCCPGTGAARKQAASLEKPHGFPPAALPGALSRWGRWQAGARPRGEEPAQAGRHPTPLARFPVARGTRMRILVRDSGQARRASFPGRDVLACGAPGSWSHPSSSVQPPQAHRPLILWDGVCGHGGSTRHGGREPHAQTHAGSLDPILSVREGSGDTAGRTEGEIMF